MSSSSMLNNNNNNNNISITVSDDEPDEFATKLRARARRRRKKISHISKSSLTHTLFKNLLRWWPVLLFLLAACLLFFEASRIGAKPKKLDQVIGKKVDKVVEKRPPPVNLNRLDPITRVVHGVREPCLKLLPVEELEQLNFPMDKAPADPIKQVVYITEANPTSVDENIPLEQHPVATRFNLFTGNQTLKQRDESFKVKGTTSLNCGFYSDKGGYRISSEDRSYMESCKAVVSTCAFGGGDDLYQPIGMSEASFKKVCFVAFWDEVTLAAQEEDGHKVGDDHHIGNWRIILVKDLPFSDQRLNGKIPKMLAHRLFPNARYSIWVDSKSQLRRDPLGVLEALLWRSNSVLANAVVKKNKATPEEVDVQLAQYRQDGLPEDKRFNGKKALAEASIIVREHTPSTNLFMCLWFNEAVRFTSRDQLSFPYVLWRFKEFKNINMFPVCIRKDLVNSMGHVRKAKPLTI